MNSSLFFDFTVKKEKNQILVKREFAAPLELVWAAWTEPDLLDLWWAPRPYHTETQELILQDGGYWYYRMVSPEGTFDHCLFRYQKVEPLKSFSGLNGFCDENKNVNTEMPQMEWTSFFQEEGENTLVQVTISFNDLSEIETIIQMGFKEGFTMALDNLDEYIKAQFYLRKVKKPNNKPRVSYYLNFPGNTEEAMNFFKEVFQTEFIGGIQRFEDIPQIANHPPMPEKVKKMVLHVELPMLGNHILMATDAPEEMGFKMTSGNNMHINLEPSSKEETTRIFNALSDGGNVTQPLHEMEFGGYWGGYYGSLTDRYGVNWMLTYNND